MPEGIVRLWPYGVDVQSYTQPTPALRMALVAPEKYLQAIKALLRRLTYDYIDTLLSGDPVLARQ